MRIAIVNDVQMAVAALKKTVLSIPGCRVAWIARDGEEAVACCMRERPDLILMDLLMPVMDGVEATRRIMKDAPCAVLIVTATVEGNAAKAFDAMGHGALDAAYTPMFQKDGALKGAEELIEKIRSISRLIPGCELTEPAKTNGVALGGECGCTFVAIGVSTGGPSTLVDLLSTLPTDLPICVAIVQHIDRRFSRGLVKWLNELVPWPVEAAEQGGSPKAGVVYVAISNAHLVLTRAGRFSYRDEPSDYPYRPSVDEFYYSLAQSGMNQGVGVLLTGMGSDGAKGLLALHRAGWRTIAQDEATSVIYGMPRAAVELGAAEQVLPLSKISGAITDLVR